MKIEVQYFPLENCSGNLCKIVVETTDYGSAAQIVMNMFNILVKYYDTYLPYIVDDDYDWSYPEPEMQLLCRLDDLQDRLEELIAKDAPYRDWDIYSEDDIRYALPEHLFDIAKVERAIELAKDDLVNKYGLPDPETLMIDESELVDEDRVIQMTLFEILPEALPKAA